MAKLLLSILCYVLLIPFTQSQAAIVTDISDNAISPNGNSTIPASNAEFPEISTENKTAEQNLKKGNIDNAVKIYQKVIAKNSQDKVASIGLIRATIEQKKYDMAKKELTLYKTKFGEDDQYLTELARYYSKTGKQQQALTILDPLLQKNPTNDTLLDIKADALANLQPVGTNSQTASAPMTQKVEQPKLQNTIKESAPIGIPVVTKAVIKINKLTNSYIEAGVERDIVSNGYGNWFNQYIKVFAQVDDKNAWYAELYHDYEFYQQGNYGKVEQTHIFNEDYYSTVSFGMSDNSIFIPKYYVGGTLFKKQLERKQLVFYLGAHAYWWRPDNTSQDINPGFVYYFEKPWIFETGLYINRSDPGSIYSASGYAAITQGREKEHYITVRVGIGREAYLPLEIPIVVGYPSQVVTVTWRQWIGQNWGTNIVAERYHNDFYNRYGITLGLFKDFAL